MFVKISQKICATSFNPRANLKNKKHFILIGRENLLYADVAMEMLDPEISAAPRTRHDRLLQMGPYRKSARNPPRVRYYAFIQPGKMNPAAYLLPLLLTDTQYVCKAVMIHVRAHAFLWNEPCGQIRDHISAFERIENDQRSSAVCRRILIRVQDVHLKATYGDRRPCARTSKRRAAPELGLSQMGCIANHSVAEMLWSPGMAHCPWRVHVPDVLHVFGFSSEQGVSFF